MSDLVVTVPKGMWFDWIDEGDAAGESPTGEEWGFYLGGARPDIQRGDRLYIVAHGRVRGYAPVTRSVRYGSQWVICREAGAVAMTIPEPVKGFQGWRRRWWERTVEIPFPAWKTEGVRNG